MKSNRSSFEFFTSYPLYISFSFLNNEKNEDKVERQNNSKKLSMGRITEQTHNKNFFCGRGSYRMAPPADLYFSYFDDPRKSTHMTCIKHHFVTKTGKLSIGQSQFEGRLYAYIFRMYSISQAVRKQREKFRYW